MYPQQKIFALAKKTENIFRQSLVINTAKLSSSNIIMYMLPILVTPILSRLYNPTDFGEWGIFSSIFTIISIGMFLGLENYIIKATNEEVKAMVQLCIWTSISVLLIVSIIYIGGIALEIQFFQTIPYPTSLLAMLCFSAIYTIFYNLCNRKELYTTLSIANIIQGSSQAALRIIFGSTLLVCINGLILGTTLAYAFSMIFLTLCFTSQNKTNKITTTKISIRQILSKYRNAVFFDAPSTLLSFAVFNLPVIILSIYIGKHDVGCFSIILQLLLLPMSFIGSAIGKVYYQQLCKYESDPKKIISITNKVIKFLAIISILPLIFITCGGDKIIVMFLGNKWQTAGYIALSLSLWSFPTILTQPILPLFRLLNQQRTMLYYDLAYFIGGIGAIIIACQYTKSIIVILTIYSIICFLVKIALFHRLLLLSNIPILSYKKAYMLWTCGILLLAIRLIV